MWKAKQKQLAVEQINGHNAKPHPLIIGRAPENTEMLFTPAELYGAMAQCSSRAKMDQRAARAQVQMCRHLIARHVDDKNDRFALLGTARRSEDLFVALAESKATKGASRAAFTKTIRDGYKEQVEPYLRRKIGSWVASHGYAVGS